MQDHLHPEDSSARRVRFCPYCGVPLEPRETYGQVRPACPRCDYLYFNDPKVVVAVIAEQEGKVLLARRAHEPGKGKWTFPSGFVDGGEQVEQAALRETQEETHAAVELERLVGVYSQPGERVILIVYSGRLLNHELRPGPEALEVGLFSPEAFPELAFPRDQAIVQDWLRLRGAS